MHQMRPSCQEAHFNRKSVEECDRLWQRPESRQRRCDAAPVSRAAGTIPRMTTEGAPVEPFPQILTTAQAAELLSVHVEYLRRMVREQRIPAHRFPGGREIRFLRD